MQVAIKFTCHNSVRVVMAGSGHNPVCTEGNSRHILLLAWMEQALFDAGVSAKIAA